MKYEIKIRTDRVFHLVCERISSNDNFETYRVYPKDNPGKFMILQNNRPLIRIKHKLKKRRIDWEVIQGPNMHQSTINQIIQAINNHLEPPPQKAKSVPYYDAPAIRKRKDKERIPLGERVKEQNKDPN